MSALTRPVSTDELERLWPAVSAAHLAHDAASFADAARAEPWTVRVSAAGDALVLGPWRAHLPLLAIRALWAPAARVGALVTEVRSLASDRGFDTVLSPLATGRDLEPYRTAGMREEARIVVFSAPVGSVRKAEPPAGIRLRLAMAGDAEALLELDAECFESFWRYGPPEFARMFEEDRVLLCEDGGGVIGYAACSHFGASATLGRLGVAPRARRLGVGRALLAAAAGDALRAGAMGMSLCTQAGNRESRELYLCAGLVRMDAEYALLSVPSRGA